jgi:transcriptional regulator with XRE-family HTH domain
MAESIGDRILRLRNSKGWSRPELGREMAKAEGRKKDYSGEAVRRWEENLSRPGVEARAALAKLFDRTESYIEFGDQPQRPNVAGEPAAEYLAGVTGEALEIARVLGPPVSQYARTMCAGRSSCCAPRAPRARTCGAERRSTTWR